MNWRTRLRSWQHRSIQTVLSATSPPLILTQQPIMVFAPHQDDETLGCGGLIALKQSVGAKVQVVFLTDGSRSDAALDPQILATVRQQESLQALKILGVSPHQIHFLAQPDGGLQQLPDPARQALIAQIVQLLMLYQPQQVFVPHRQDRHYFGDHEATYALVRAAIRQLDIMPTLYQYPVWLFWQAILVLDLKLSELAGSVHLSIDRVLERKRQALACYRSQPFPPGFLDRAAHSCELFFTDPVE